jgi:TolB-like protein/Tfp pilus assembly protein PilF/predicted Ser/Thr protein kinase
MALEPGERLGPYEIVTPIGEGGMGQVYRAKDTRMRRDVAIKLITEGFSERFSREVRAIAALNHPNICTIHDVGPNYFVMEYVSGSPLEGPLPEAKAIQVAQQIAAALEAAHARGIIHRDLKPANILMTGDAVKLVDFGLATHAEWEPVRSSAPATVIRGANDSDGPAGSVVESLATLHGTVMGTPAYMSPEQATGVRVDVRTDIFSFGAVLYELVSGRRAFRADSVTAMSAVVRFQEPTPLSASPEVVDLVAKCLRKAPDARFQNVLELQLALEKVAAALAKKAPSVAVLPFVATGGQPENEYFGDGLAEDIIDALSRVEGLSVIARTSSFAFRHQAQDVRGIAKALGVNHLLEGSVRTAGGRIRVNARLIAAADGSQVWSKRYDRDLVDVFAIQDEISNSIATELRVSLAHRPLARRPTAQFAAYEAVLRGRHHFIRFDPDDQAKAIACFDEAVAIDPNYADAHIGRALFHWGQMVVGLADPRAAMTQSVASARVALRLDPSSSAAHHILASYFAVHEFDWAEAEQYFRQALALNPNSVDAYHCYTLYYLGPLGRMEEALKAQDFALTKDPLALHLLFVRALILESLGREEDAATTIEQINDLDSSFVFGQLHLVQLRGRQRRFAEAVQLAERMTQLTGRWGATLGALGIAHAMAGHEELAKAVIAELAASDSHEESRAFYTALIAASLGDKRAAFEWAARSIEHRDHVMPLYLRSPSFDLLRADGSHSALLRLMKAN